MKGVWNYLSGKKTLVGLFVYFVLGGLRGVGMLDDAAYNQVLPYVNGLVGVGVAHKVWKWSH